MLAGVSGSITIPPVPGTEENGPIRTPPSLTFAPADRNPVVEEVAVLSISTLHLHRQKTTIETYLWRSVGGLVLRIDGISNVHQITIIFSGPCNNQRNADT